MMKRILRPYSQFNRKTYSLGCYSCKPTVVLGIETSCDDTGCAVVNSAGEILGESLYSQNAVHIRYGGVNPIVARDLHRDNIESAVQEALEKSNCKIQDIDAVAVTTKPGLLISLQIGVKYAKYLARKYSKPLIPIHHMEAHALVSRMFDQIPFPFLVLLLSGGDCLLAVVRDVNDFLLLGKTLDNAPGEIMDKVARRLKLKNIPDYSQLAGGRAIELAARKANNSKLFEFPLPLLRNRDCNFSFSGLKDALVRKLVKIEEKHGINGGEVIPHVNDICAAFQLAIAEHIVHRTARAIAFSEKYNLIDKNIVVSGGVACNDFIFKSLEVLGEKLAYKVYRPPPNLCTDNGVMIAWNGIERLRKQNATVSDIDFKDIDPDAVLGTNYIKEVIDANLPTKVLRLNKVYALYLEFSLVFLSSVVFHFKYSNIHKFSLTPIVCR